MLENVVIGEPQSEIFSPHARISSSSSGGGGGGGGEQCCQAPFSERLETKKKKEKKGEERKKEKEGAFPLCATPFEESVGESFFSDAKSYFTYRKDVASPTYLSGFVLSSYHPERISQFLLFFFRFHFLTDASGLVSDSQKN